MQHLYNICVCVWYVYTTCRARTHVLFNNIYIQNIYKEPTAQLLPRMKYIESESHRYHGKRDGAQFQVCGGYNNSAPHKHGPPIHGKRVWPSTFLYPTCEHVLDTFIYSFRAIRPVYIYYIRMSAPDCAVYALLWCVGTVHNAQNVIIKHWRRRSAERPNEQRRSGMRQEATPIPSIFLFPSFHSGHRILLSHSHLTYLRFIYIRC